MLSYLRTRPPLSIITVAFIATVVLALLPKTPNQNNSTHSEKPVSQETGDLAEDIIAVFTVVLAGVGGLTYLTFNRQADIMETQTRLESARFAAEHQPKIIVYGFRWKDTEKAIVGGGSSGVYFKVVNVGRQGGTWTEIGTKLQYSTNAAHPPGSDIKMNLRTSNLRRIPQSGTPKQFGTLDFEAFNPDTMEGRFVREKKWALYCVGYIAYVADDGTPHRTGFCQKYNPVTWRWEPFDDSEYVFAY